jgi:hypothetical protein
MALFSDVDWAILLVIGAFLFFGPENRAVLRTLGRYYGRAMRMRQELLSEVTQATELPLGPGGRSTSLRGALLGGGPLSAPAPSIPAAVTQAPVLTYPPSGSAWTGVMGPQSWSFALPPVNPEPAGGR